MLVELLTLIANALCHMLFVFQCYDAMLWQFYSLQGRSAWHSFAFNCHDNKDVSIVSMTSRPDSIGRNVTTVLLPACDTSVPLESVDITVYCHPPAKDLTTGSLLFSMI